MVRTLHNLRARTCLAALLLCAEAFAFAGTGAPAPDEKPPPIRLDEVKLPTSDAILVICERAAEALRVLPKYYYAVPPKEYDALLAKIDYLNRQLLARQSAPVSEVKLAGQVKANRVELTATFVFTTDKDALTVALGCRQAIPWSVLLDDAVPRLRSSPTEGLFVEVDNAGRHTVTVKMLLPLREVTPSVEPLEGFELDLPLAPTTNLASLELPEGARSVEVYGDRNDPLPRAFVQVDKNQVNASLGKASRLKVAWKKPTPTAATPISLASSRGKIVVHLGSKDVTTKAELKLIDLGRSVRDWKLQLPEGADVQLANPGDRDRLRGAIQGNRSKDGLVTIPLKAASTTPLTVAVSVVQPRGSGPLLLGPFAAVGAVSQAGTLWVVTEGRPAIHCSPFSSGPGDPPLGTTPRRLDSPDEEGNRPPPDADAAFQYWSLPGEQQVDSRDPWFRLEVDPIQGILATRLEHTLTFSREGGWRLRTVVHAEPIRSGVDQVEFESPVPWKFDEDRLPEGVRSIEHEAGRRTTRLRLASESLKPFQLGLEFRPEDQAGPFPPAPDVPAGGAVSSAVLKLPRPRGPTDRTGHDIVVQAPDLDLREPQPANPQLVLVKQEAHRLVWRAERFPSQVAVAWRPYRPEVGVDSDIDVTLTGSEVKMTHRLQLSFPESDKVPASVLLRVPREVEALTAADGPLEIAEPPVKDGAPAPAGRTVRCPLGASARADRARTLTLEYRARLAGQGDRGTRASGSPALVVVPLVSVASATHGQVDVRVWAGPGVRIRAEGTWDTGPLKAVAGKSVWATLVLRNQRPSPGRLTLRCDDPFAREGTPTPQVKRSLIQVKVAEGGFQHYRILFLLRIAPGPGDSTLDLVFPAPLATLADRQILLDGKLLTSWEVVNPPSSGDARKEEGRLVRVRLPAGPEGRTAVLEVGYHLVAGRPAEDGPLRTTFQPVTLPGLLTGVPTRWQVELPAGWVPLSLEGGPVSLRWGWRGWLLAPRPASTSADLLDWFRGDEVGLSPLPEDAGLVPAFDGWRGEPAALTLYHVPQQAWLLVCSLGLLALGLGLYLLPLGGQADPTIGGPPNRLFWPLGALFGLSAAAVGLVWPGLLGAILYGCQPGMVVLLVVLALQWLVRERYRRRVVFLPGFRRLKTGSSMVRSSGSSGGSGRPSAGEAAPLPEPPQEAARPADAGGPRAGAGAPPARSHPSVPKVRGEPSTVDEPAPGAEG